MAMSHHCLRLVTGVLALSLVACGGPKQEHAGLAKASQGFARLAAPKDVRMLEEGYLGLRRLPMDDEHAPILQTSVTLRTEASLSELCDTLMRLVPLQVHLVREGKIPGESNGSAADPALLQLLGDEADRGEGVEKRLSINHEGPFVGLLDQIAAQSGYGWDYERASNTLTIARNMVKTFFLKTAPGKIGVTSALSNESRELAQNTQTGTFGQSEKRTNTQPRTSQNFAASLAFDVFADTVRSVQSMLSPEGHVESNEAAGSISVSDHPERLRRIGRYISQVNESLSRQVAMKVNVYSLESTDGEAMGLDLALLLPSLGEGAMGVASGALPAVQSLAGRAQASIFNGQLKGSTAMLTALKQFGRARQITSAGIVAMNNQPAPVEAIQKTSYLAGSSIETREHSTETSLLPGEVTTGFSMTITPHILSERKVVLQYTVHLSTLEGMDAFESSHARIQLPRVSSRAFSQRATLLMGQTLVLAGFEQAGKAQQTRLGLLGLGRENTESRSLIIVTIEVENAAPDIAEQANHVEPLPATLWQALSHGTVLVSA